MQWKVSKGSHQREAGVNTMEEELEGSEIQPHVTHVKEDIKEVKDEETGKND